MGISCLRLACLFLFCRYSPTNPRMACTIGGTEVKASVIIPKSVIDKLDRAAARGSVTRSRAVAIADELPPSVTPRVT
jgi:hypothetical protein